MREARCALGALPCELSQGGPITSRIPLLGRNPALGGFGAFCGRLVAIHTRCSLAHSEQLSSEAEVREPCAADRRGAGLAVLSTIATTRADDVMARGASSLPNALTEGFQRAFLGGAVIAALGVVATLVLIRTRDSKAHVEMSNEQTATVSA